jgi:hypothetical protein
MPSATDFYYPLTRMNEAELLEYEDAIHNDLRITTDKLERALRNGLEYDVLEGEHFEFFHQLLTIRDFMYRKNIQMPVRTPSQYMIRIVEMKDRCAQAKIDRDLEERQAKQRGYYTIDGIKIKV